MAGWPFAFAPGRKPMAASVTRPATSELPRPQQPSQSTLQLIDTVLGKPAVNGPGCQPAYTGT